VPLLLHSQASAPQKALHYSLPLLLMSKNISSTSLSTEETLEPKRNTPSDSESSEKPKPDSMPSTLKLIRLQLLESTNSPISLRLNSSKDLDSRSDPRPTIQMLNTHILMQLQPLLPLIGELRALSLELRIKDSADHAGPSQLLVHSKVPIILLLAILCLFQNNNLSIVTLRTVTKVAMVVKCTLL
jgi:hypothetical protein